MKHLHLYTSWYKHVVWACKSCAEESLARFNYSPKYQNGHLACTNGFAALLMALNMYEIKCSR